MRKSDIIIIGCGPGGMEAASIALAKGLDTVVIERDEPGGTCLNRGCIPTKALCSSADIISSLKESATFGVKVDGVSLSYADAVARKEAVIADLRANVAAMMSRATYVKGEARFVSADTVAVGDEQFSAPKIILATGSATAMLPIPGAELSITSDDVLSLTSLPEKMAIIGGGVIGMELACILNAFGVKVTILEYCKEILPNFDRDIAKRLHSLLSRRGIDIITSAQVTSIASGKKVGYLAKGKELSIEADEVVMAVGRRPVVPEGAEAAGIKLNRGAVVVDEALLSSVPGVYAIGDVNAHMMLAHVASAQAIAAMGGTINLDVVPSAVFTSPECSMVGLTEEQCKDKGFEYVAAKSLFRANGKAMAMGEPDGLVKLIVDKTSRKILGCSICGAHAADLIQEVATVMSAGLTVDAITQTIHAHPTLGEVVHTAAASL